MDPVIINSTTQLLDLINAGGVTAILIILIAMFIRGDIIPRKLYERMLRDTLSKIAADIIASVTMQLSEQNRLVQSEIQLLSARFNNIEKYVQDRRDDE